MRAVKNRSKAMQDEKTRIAFLRQQLKDSGGKPRTGILSCMQIQSWKMATQESQRFVSGSCRFPAKLSANTDAKCCECTVLHGLLSSLVLCISTNI